MKKTLIAAAAASFALAGGAAADDVKLGVILGYTGPLESITPAMAAGAELAMKEVTDAGGILGGMNVVSVRGDSTCIDAAAASAAAERLITSDGIAAIVGADCSGVTTAILQNVALANGVVMVSPSATSPALTTIEDNGLFFRTSPSDARQGKIVSDVLTDKGVKEIAISYTNNDYGKGLADSIETNFKAAGGSVTINASHEDGKADYSAEVGALAAAGGEVLVVAGYVDQGGKGIIQASLDSGAFDTFYLPDGMVGQALPDAIGDGLNGSYGALPGTDSEGATNYLKMAEEAGFTSGAFSPESYDAAALIMLAMEAAGSTDSAAFKDKVMEVANAPGEQIQPGELAKALKIIRDGGDIDYVGASAVELIEPGESAGNYREIKIEDGKIETVGYR
ncbi:ABC transporter substrate-binding protein [Pikeienuella piscinae]|uniref:ABC transporter substrate-binding protein n=1 Tax=Pikeienuella piscinae TaxID=2748098 RepID=A0A7L5BY00_9RHOB|nr:ABC transporter substrate-binding protein [Pikeienuella piscinae]QIE55718.1 ABC transporter substrate-binding protein [Pikeienuella piscinae]